MFTVYLIFPLFGCEPCRKKWIILFKFVGFLFYLIIQHLLQLWGLYLEVLLGKQTLCVPKVFSGFFLRSELIPTQDDYKMTENKLWFSNRYCPTPVFDHLVVSPFTILLKTGY